MRLSIVFSIILFTAINIFGNYENDYNTDANVFGHVLNAEDGTHIPFINVIIENSRIGTITDASGHYMLTNLPAGNHILVVKGMGYETARVEFESKAGQSMEINIEVEFSGLNLDEIVITSSPTARGFRYQPDNVYIGEELQRRAEVSFGEMLDGEPGIAMRSMGSAPSRPVIRGMDGDRILILQNGERMGDISETSAGHAISLDPLSANRVEVVRGPASLLYGSSAIGGVINLITADIPDNREIGASGVFALHGASMNNMGAGFGRYTWGNENLAATGRFGYRKAGDVRTPDGTIPSTYMDTYDGSLGLGFNNNKVNGGFNVALGKQNYGIPEEIDNPFENAEVRIQQQMIQGRLHFGLSNFFDKAQLRLHASRFIQQEVEIDSGESLIHEDIEIQFNKYNISSTFTVQHKPLGILDRGAIGVNLYGRKLDITGDDGFTPDEERFNIGLFTFQEIPVNARIRLQFGGRMDYQKATAQPNAFSSLNASREAFVYSGSIGLNYRPVEGLEVGGQFARSHRYPMLEELFAYGAHLCAGQYEIGDVNMGDEIGYGSDLFVRWINGILKTEVAGFFNYFSNYIILQPTGNFDDVSGFPIVEYQEDKARLYGGEAIIGLQIADALTTDFSVDYVIGQRLSSGIQHLPFMPPFRFSATIEYDYGSGWIGSRLRAVSEQNNVAPGEESTAGYTLIGFNTGYRLNGSGQHVIILRIENLLDKRYRDHLSRIEERNFPMPGRNFNIAYRWFF